MRQLFLITVALVFVAGCSGKRGPSPEAEIILKQDRTAWKKLTKGMTQDKVKGLLGDPVRTDQQGDVACWFFRPTQQPLEKDALNPSKWRVPRGSVLFAGKGTGDFKLTEWNEP